MKEKLTFTGRIIGGMPRKPSELLTVSGEGFIDIYNKLMYENLCDSDLRLGIIVNQNRVLKYYETNELTELICMDIINESTAPNENDPETRWGTWSKEEGGKKHYLRSIDTKTGEWNFWTE